MDVSLADSLDSLGNTHMFEFEQDLPVELHALPVGVFNGHDVSLKEHKATHLTHIWKQAPPNVTM